MLITDKLLAELGLKIEKIGHSRKRCPKCSDTRKKKYSTDLSVDITDEDAKWLCHHCGYSGFVTVTKQAAKLPPTLPPITPAAEKWFKSRGIPLNVLQRNKIGCIKTYMPDGEDTVCITFPYFRDSLLTNIKYRSFKKQFKMEAGAELLLYKLDDITSSVIVTEGECDALSFEVAGLLNAVSVPGGAPPLTAKNPNLDYLNDARLDKVEKFILAVDADAPGRKLNAELVRRLGPERCWVVEWPDDTKDANEVLVKYGPVKLQELVAEAKQVPIIGLVEANDRKAHVFDIYDHGHSPGENPGTDALAHYYTVKPGQLSIVTGVPSAGKSAWVDWVMYSLAQNSNWRFGICSPENFPVEEHIIKFAELKTGKPFYGDRKMSRAEAGAAVDWVHDHFYFINQEEDVQDWSIAGVLKLGQALVRRKGINGMVLDPYNEFDHTRANGLSETEHISRVLSQLRQFARSNNVHMWLVAHPYKMRKLEDGTYPIPGLYDISGSAHFRNKADFGVVVHREISSNSTLPVTIDVQKVRFKRCGNVGSHLMLYDYNNNRYSDYASEL